MIFQWKFRCNFLAIRASTQVRTFETSCNLESWLHSSTAVSTKNSIPNRSSFFTNLWYVPLICSIFNLFSDSGKPLCQGRHNVFEMYSNADGHVKTALWKDKSSSSSKTSSLPWKGVLPSLESKLWSVLCHRSNCKNKWVIFIKFWANFNAFL